MSRGTTTIAVQVAHDHVARVDHDPAAGDRVADLARAAVQRADRRHAAREDGEVAEVADRGEVADEAVDDEAGDAAVAGLGGDEVAEDSGERGCARVDDDDVTRLGDVERLVDHQVVARETLTVKAGPTIPRSGWVCGLIAGSMLYSRFIRSEITGVSNAPSPVTVAGSGRSQVGADPEARARVHLGGLRLANHGETPSVDSVLVVANRSTASRCTVTTGGPASLAWISIARASSRRGPGCRLGWPFSGSVKPPAPRLRTRAPPGSARGPARVFPGC